MKFPVDLLARVSQEELEQSAESYMKNLLLSDPDAPEHLIISGSTQVPIDVSSVGYIPLYGFDKQKMLALFTASDRFTAVALYLLDRWWTVEDILKTADNMRDGAVEVKTVGEKIVLYILNRIIYRAREMSPDELPFLCHGKQDFAKILWKDGEAVGFYSVKRSGSLLNSFSSKRFHLPVMNSIFVRKSQRGKGFSLQMLEDYVQSFEEDCLGLKYPLTKSMYKVCEKFLGQYPGDTALLWEVEGVGGPKHQTNIANKIQAMALSAVSKTMSFSEETVKAVEAAQTELVMGKISKQMDNMESMKCTVEIIEEVTVVTVSKEPGDIAVVSRNRSSGSHRRKTKENASADTSENVIRVEDIEAETPKEVGVSMEQLAELQNIFKVKPTQVLSCDEKGNSIDNSSAEELVIDAEKSAIDKDSPDAEQHIVTSVLLSEAIQVQDDVTCPTNFSSNSLITVENVVSESQKTEAGGQNEVQLPLLTESHDTVIEEQHKVVCDEKQDTNFHSEKIEIQTLVRQSLRDSRLDRGITLTGITVQVPPIHQITSQTQKASEKSVEELEEVTKELAEDIDDLDGIGKAGHAQATIEIVRNEMNDSYMTNLEREEEQKIQDEESHTDIPQTVDGIEKTLVNEEINAKEANRQTEETIGIDQDNADQAKSEEEKPKGESDGEDIFAGEPSASLIESVINLTEKAHCDKTIFSIPKLQKASVVLVDIKTIGHLNVNQAEEECSSKTEENLDLIFEMEREGSSSVVGEQIEPKELVEDLVGQKEIDVATTELELSDQNVENKESADKKMVEIEKHIRETGSGKKSKPESFRKSKSGMHEEISEVDISNSNEVDSKTLAGDLAQENLLPNVMAKEISFEVDNEPVIETSARRISQKLTVTPRMSKRQEIKQAAINVVEEQPPLLIRTLRHKRIEVYATPKRKYRSSHKLTNEEKTDKNVEDNLVKEVELVDKTGEEPEEANLKVDDGNALSENEETNIDLGVKATPTTSGLQDDGTGKASSKEVGANIDDQSPPITRVLRSGKKTLRSPKTIHNELEEDEETTEFNVNLETAEEIMQVEEPVTEELAVLPFTKESNTIAVAEIENENDNNIEETEAPTIEARVLRSGKKFRRGNKAVSQPDEGDRECTSTSEETKIGLVEYEEEFAPETLVKNVDKTEQKAKTDQAKDVIKEFPKEPSIDKEKHFSVSEMAPGEISLSKSVKDTSQTVILNISPQEVTTDKVADTETKLTDIEVSPEQPEEILSHKTIENDSEKDPAAQEVEHPETEVEANQVDTVASVTITDLNPVEGKQTVTETHTDKQDETLVGGGTEDTSTATEKVAIQEEITLKVQDEDNKSDEEATEEEGTVVETRKLRSVQRSTPATPQRKSRRVLKPKEVEEAQEEEIEDIFDQKREIISDEDANAETTEEDEPVEYTRILRKGTKSITATPRSQSKRLHTCQLEDENEEQSSPIKETQEEKTNVAPEGKKESGTHQKVTEVANEDPCEIMAEAEVSQSEQKNVEEKQPDVSETGLVSQENVSVGSGAEETCITDTNMAFERGEANTSMQSLSEQECLPAGEESSEEAEPLVEKRVLRKRKICTPATSRRRSKRTCKKHETEEDEIEETPPADETEEEENKTRQEQPEMEEEITGEGEVGKENDQAESQIGNATKCAIKSSPSEDEMISSENAMILEKLTSTELESEPVVDEQFIESIVSETCLVGQEDVSVGCGAEETSTTDTKVIFEEGEANTSFQNLSDQDGLSAGEESSEEAEPLVKKRVLRKRGRHTPTTSGRRSKRTCKKLQTEEDKVEKNTSDETEEEKNETRQEQPDMEEETAGEQEVDTENDQLESQEGNAEETKDTLTEDTILLNTDALENTTNIMIQSSLSEDEKISTDNEGDTGVEEKLISSTELESVTVVDEAEKEEALLVSRVLRSETKTYLVTSSQSSTNKNIEDKTLSLEEKSLKNEQNKDVEPMDAEDKEQISLTEQEVATDPAKDHDEFGMFNNKGADPDLVENNEQAKQLEKSINKESIEGVETMEEISDLRLDTDDEGDKDRGMSEDEIEPILITRRDLRGRSIPAMIITPQSKSRQSSTRVVHENLSSTKAEESLSDEESPSQSQRKSSRKRRSTAGTPTHRAKRHSRV